MTLSPKTLNIAPINIMINEHKFIEHNNPRDNGTQHKDTA